MKFNQRLSFSALKLSQKLNTFKGRPSQLQFEGEKKKFTKPGNLALFVFLKSVKIEFHAASVILLLATGKRDPEEKIKDTD